MQYFALIKVTKLHLVQSTEEYDDISPDDLALYDLGDESGSIQDVQTGASLPSDMSIGTGVRQAPKVLSIHM